MMKWEKQKKNFVNKERANEELIKKKKKLDDILKQKEDKIKQQDNSIKKKENNINKLNEQLKDEEDIFKRKK